MTRLVAGATEYLDEAIIGDATIGEGVMTTLDPGTAILDEAIIG